jgi:hypothetical protein
MFTWQNNKSRYHSGDKLLRETRGLVLQQNHQTDPNVIGSRYGVAAVAK